MTRLLHDCARIIYAYICSMVKDRMRAESRSKLYTRSHTAIRGPRVWRGWCDIESL